MLVIICAGVFSLAFTLLVCIYQTIAFQRLVRYVTAQLQVVLNAAFLPYVSLILPCKGLDQGFEDNVRRLLRQDYLRPDGQPAFELIFAVADESDPAYSVLNRIISEPLPHLTQQAIAGTQPAKLVVAGYNPTRAQKINNQLTALKHIDSRCEVLVFADSDVIARENFLHNLVAPLEDESIGVTTGYRFYLHRPGNLACLLRSLWNRMSAWEMADPKFAFAWGGAMAVRRELFLRASIADCWDRAADDDLSLTTAIRKLGKKIHFVPQCLVTTKSDEGWREVVEWMNRQLILTKVYFRPLWIKAVVKAAFMAAWLVLLIVTITACCVSNSWHYRCLLVLVLAIIPVEFYFLIVGRSLWAPLLNESNGNGTREFISTCLAVPLGHLILPWLTLYSVVTNRISWRGVTYELRAPDNIHIIR